MFLFCKPNMDFCKDFSYQLINSIKHKPMKDIIISNIKSFITKLIHTPVLRKQ